MHCFQTINSKKKKFGRHYQPNLYSDIAEIYTNAYNPNRVSCTNQHRRLQLLVAGKKHTYVSRCRGIRSVLMLFKRQPGAVLACQCLSETRLRESCPPFNVNRYTRVNNCTYFKCIQSTFEYSYTKVSIVIIVLLDNFIIILFFTAQRTIFNSDGFYNQILWSIPVHRQS